MPYGKYPSRNKQYTRNHVMPRYKKYTLAQKLAYYKRLAGTRKRRYR